jgi:polyphosphate kinase
MDAKLRVRMPKEGQFDRDLSWLEIQPPGPAEAIDDACRCSNASFPAIFTSNLDEFFMKRVGAMRTRAYASGNLAVVEEFNAHIHRLRDALYPLLLRRAACFRTCAIGWCGMGSAAWDELSPAQRARRASISSATYHRRSPR